MKTLNRTLRKDLENAIRRARVIAEKGAMEALERLAVGAPDPWSPMTEPQRHLRRRLRARARQLGDHRNPNTQTQDVGRLIQECAYEHWHRLVFSKFLAESNLLVEPSTQVAISIEECKELAIEQRVDWLSLASVFAQKMLPLIFRQGDPVLEIQFTPEIKQQLEAIIGALPSEVFLARDSLGWLYQFWQAQKKEEVNESGRKIGADELPAVTQLFTEDYMVEFLLHNTIGAWWAGKYGPIKAADEDEARQHVLLASKEGLPPIEWRYLRLMQDECDKLWRPAAGTFPGWPAVAKDITLLDPSMGSGHFLAFALPIIARLRMEEENLNSQQALVATLEKNIYGLELDQRCAQIAAFNLALTAWKLGGYRLLPVLHLACSGLAPHVPEKEWAALAGGNDRLKRGMVRLHALFKDAPILGSLINPSAVGGDLVEANFRELQPLLEKALAQETKDDNVQEMSVTARGLAKAAEILASQFTLVATNVPYLGRKKHDDTLKSYCEHAHPDAKADLATCFLERSLTFCTPGGSTALVTPQNWLSLGGYEKLRQTLLRVDQWDFVVRLGPKAFQTPMWDFNILLVGITRSASLVSHCLSSLDASELSTPTDKDSEIRAQRVVRLSQKGQLLNPDSRISSSEQPTGGKQFGEYVECYQGVVTGDLERFRIQFWEVQNHAEIWRPFRTTISAICKYDGLDSALRWEGGRGELHEYAALTRDQLHDMHESGNRAWSKIGVAINRMAELRASSYLGEIFDNNVAVAVPKDASHLPAILAFCSDPEFHDLVRTLDQTLKVTNRTLVKVPFDLAHWQRMAIEKYPRGLPKPFSSDPTQWLFNGHPKDSDQPLSVAVARLLGYRWPRQNGSNFPDCPSLGPDGLEKFSDDDGIVCLSPVNREEAGVSRLRTLLINAFGAEWSATKERDLLFATGTRSSNLDKWLRDDFFKEHCATFQQRPFIWHIWDGLVDGFSVLLNYHKLVESNSAGRKLLEKLTYTYLGDWISRQEQDQKAGTAGADAKVAAAKHLKGELEKILRGDPPYDVFVRWKPLHEQSIGWEPDVNDGVRINIRPFLVARTLGSNGKSGGIFRITPKIKWEKDRGREPARRKEDFPWFWSWDNVTQDFMGGEQVDGNRWNDLSYSRATKQQARDRYRNGVHSGGPV